MYFERIDETVSDRPAEWPEHFQGEARIQRFTSPLDHTAVLAVHFHPGGRTKPHRHRSGQVLVIVEGKGMVGGSAGRRIVEAGDVVVAMPDEWHWHGATPDSAMTHVTVQTSEPDSVEWNVEERDWADDYARD